MSAAVLPFRPRELLLKQGIGARVFHDKHGLGTVRIVRGNRLTVDFDHAGRKIILAAFVRGWAGVR